jgi:hypothetical protein
MTSLEAPVDIVAYDPSWPSQFPGESEILELTAQEPESFVRAVAGRAASRIWSGPSWFGGSESPPGRRSEREHRLTLKDLCRLTIKCSSPRSMFGSGW